MHNRHITSYSVTLARHMKTRPLQSVVLIILSSMHCLLHMNIATQINYKNRLYSHFQNACTFFRYILCLSLSLPLCICLFPSVLSSLFQCNWHFQSVWTQSLCFLVPIFIRIIYCQNSSESEWLTVRHWFASCTVEHCSKHLVEFSL